MKRINEIPFDSDRKMMTTIHKVGDKYRIITKGAPDVLLKRCSKILMNKNIHNIQNYIYKIESLNNKMANGALRVLAVAYLDVDELPNQISSKTIENNLIFVRINRND